MPEFGTPFSGLANGKKNIILPFIFLLMSLVIGCHQLQSKSGGGICEAEVISYEDSPFGAHGAFSRPFHTDELSKEQFKKMISELKDPYKHVKDVGIKWIRPGTDIYWTLVQPTPEHVENGLYDWGMVDNLYGRVPSGVNVLANICPGRHGTRDQTWRFIDMFAEKKYIEFVKRLVERYDGDGLDDMPGLKKPIKYWQIENEPALFYGLRLDWQGFSHLVEITYNIIKENDPQAKIALGGLVGGNEVNNVDIPFYPLFRKQVEEFYLPLLNNLQGKYIDIFDIHYYFDLREWPNAWQENWQDMQVIYEIFRKALDRNGYNDTEIWFTETAVPSKPHGERKQAISLIKRFIFAMSIGVEKIFWWNMIEGEAPLEDNQPTDHLGLIYDGIGIDDKGYGTKKLAYYSYKKMVEVLEGSDWDNIEIVQEKDNIYIYMFTKQGKSIWVAWNDKEEKKTIGIILDEHTKAVRITEAVPKYKSGEEIVNYNTAFETEIITVQNAEITIVLRESPVFIEEIDEGIIAPK